MKSILCAVTLGAVTILFVNVKASQEGVCDVEDIGDISPHVSYDVFDLPSPRTDIGKCVYDCMMRLSDMLGENGLIDVNKFVDILNKTRKHSHSTLTKIRSSTEVCNKYFLRNRCETAGLFMQCSYGLAKKNGLDPMTIPKAIHYSYYALPLEKRLIPEGKPWPTGTFLFNYPVLDWWPKNKQKK